MASRSEQIAAWTTAIAAIAAVAVAYFSLRDTARQLLGKTIYDVAKDGAQLQRKYDKGEADPNEVMSYFFSVYQLRKADVLGSSQWATVQTALCEFSKSGNNVKQSWEKNKDFYDKDFSALVDKLRGQQKCE
jgi:hypothetical protein